MAIKIKTPDELWAEEHPPRVRTYAKKRPIKPWTRTFKGATAKKSTAKRRSR